MMNLDFDPLVLRAMIGGASVLNLPSLRIFTREQAKDFVGAYGYNLDDEADSARLWSSHRRAVTYIETQLLSAGEKVPEEIGEPVLLKDLANLLLWASDFDNAGRQRWACVVLRVMHVISHLSNDLFTSFSDEIQEQILRPYQSHIVTDELGRVTLGRADADERIPLEKFDIKPFKTSNSSITKLLAKPEEVAFGLMDKMGVRFVTRNIFDCFRVLRWLVKHNVVSYPHLIPDESNNTLYPLDLFVETVRDLREGGGETPERVERELRKRLSERGGQGLYREKLNAFTSRDYRFIKFIVRKLIRTGSDGAQRPFMFYYPYEVQIMDRETYAKNSEGPCSHVEYKARQKQKARERVFSSTGNQS